MPITYESGGLSTIDGMEHFFMGWFTEFSPFYIAPSNAGKNYVESYRSFNLEKGKERGEVLRILG